MKAFVPIKDHSERIPRKNFKLLHGIPLYHWIVSSLLESNLVEKVYIDTDSTDSALWALDTHPRISIRRRAAHLVGDFVSMNLLIENFLGELEDHEDVLMTHTTNPFLSSVSIQNAFEIYKEGSKAKSDSLFSVTEFYGRFYDKSLSPINHNLSELKRTQDLDPVYLENSCMYIFSKNIFLQNKSRIGKNPIKFVLSGIESVDIDNTEDWDLASVIASSMDYRPSIPAC